MGFRLVTIDMGGKLEAVPLFEGDLGPHPTQCGGAEVYLHDKFHLDPSTIHQRRRQTGYDRQTDTGQTTVR